MVRRWLARLVAGSIGICVLAFGNDAVGQPVVLESAVLGATGRIGGTSVSVAQFVGWRFEIDEALEVERVGGHLLGYPDAPGGIFAALVELESIDSVPLGAPFTAEEVVASTTFEPPFPSAEVFVPLSATLFPGSYALVLGTGLFGATGEGAIHNGDDQPDIPPTDLSSFIFWSVPSPGQPFEWRLNLASHMRFVIEAEVLNIPGDYDRDGNVDAEDYAVWRSDFGSAADLDADGNENGVVDSADYVVWRDNFEAGTGSGFGESPVPEPTTVMLLAAVAVVLVARQLRGHVRSFEC